MLGSLIDLPKYDVSSDIIGRRKKVEQEKSNQFDLKNHTHKNNKIITNTVASSSMMYTLEQLQEYKLNKCKNSKCPPGKRQLCWYYHDAYDRRRPVSNGMNPNQPYKYFHEDCN